MMKNTERAPICFFNKQVMSIEEAKSKLSIHIPGYPEEEFAYIISEYIENNKYLITSYGRVFTSYGRELVQEYSQASNVHPIHCRVGLKCLNGNFKHFRVHKLVANAFIIKTKDDINNNRDRVYHLYNRDGRCNYVWNLIWCNKMEIDMLNRTVVQFDPNLFNINHIIDRNTMLINNTSKSKRYNYYLSEYQVGLICYAATVLHYDAYQCAYYAYLNPNNKNHMSVVMNILNGKTYTDISSKYGI